MADVKYEKLTIILTDSPSEINRAFLKHIDDIMASIIRMKYMFVFEIAKAEDKAKYDAKGIKDFPTMLVKNETVVGAKGISARLSNIVRKYRQGLAAHTQDIIPTLTSEALAGVSIEGKRIVDASPDIDNPEDHKSGVQARVDMELKRRQALHSHEQKRTQGKLATLSSTKATTSGSLSSTHGDNIRPPDVAIHEPSASSILDTVIREHGAGEDDELLRKFYQRGEVSAV